MGGWNVRRCPGRTQSCSWPVTSWPPTAARGAGSGGDRYQVMVHVDQDVLAPDGQWAATLEDGTRVSAETLRRVACDAGLVPCRAAGDTVDVGRRTRSIPPAIRRALWLRDRGCRFPGCTHTRFLHGHHIHHWLHGGATRLDNLVLLCGRHHQLVHEGGFQVQFQNETSGIVFTAPSGRSLPQVPRREQIHQAMRALQQWAIDHGIDINPHTNLPWWDGDVPDYDLVVSALLRN